MSVKMRQLVEREIVMATVDALLAAGFNISINNGQSDAGTEYQLYKSTDREEILKNLFLTDEDMLVVGKNSPSRPNVGHPWVQFIYGNEGPDVMSDYSTDLEQYIGAPWTHPQIIAAKYGG